MYHLDTNFPKIYVENTFQFDTMLSFKLKNFIKCMFIEDVEGRKLQRLKQNLITP
jgi:hypothetical protein